MFNQSTAAGSCTATSQAVGQSKPHDLQFILTISRLRASQDILFGAVVPYSGNIEALASWPLVLADERITGFGDPSIMTDEFA